MTPKEKAKHLVDKYFEKFSDDSGCGWDIDCSKICALIAVDEILEEIYYTESTTYGCTYWQEVKKEIEKL